MRYLALFACCLVSTVAHANGRPPLTNGIYFQANDTHALYVRTTFGLLVSHDDGCSFRWTCEQNIGYGGMYDPVYAIAADGAVYATSFNGLRVSRDGGCSFTTPTSQLPDGDPGKIAGRYVATIDIGPTGDVWVATADNGKSNNAFRSTDGGVTFKPGGMASTTLAWNAIAVAPSDAMHVYLAGNQMMPSPAAHLFATLDAGAHWTEGSLAGMQFGTPPQLKIAAIDRADPRRLFVISIGANVDGDRLYRSIDGGATFSEVLATNEPIAGVAIRDATTVIAAAGIAGAFRSGDGGASFQAVASSPQLACLGTRPDGTLVGCAANWEPDFMAVAASGDASHWDKLFRFVELDGPLACPVGTAGHDICDQQLWSGLQQQFGATGPTCAGGTDLVGGAVDMAPISKSGGCCDAGGAPPLGCTLLSLATFWTCRRRRR